MSIFFVKNEQVNGESAVIIGEDVKHIRDVLRYEINDELSICDENGIKYNTHIINFQKDKVELKVFDTLNETSEPQINITLFQGMPKADKLEFIIQKCTEIGVNEVVPVITDRVIVKIDEKSLPKKLERWNKIALEASKQSGRQRVPDVKMPINLKNLVENISKYDILLLPYECEKSTTIKMALKDLDKNYKNVAILIGPEGGFSKEEVELLNFENVKKITLGPRILRTETASIVTLAIALYELDM